MVSRLRDRYVAETPGSHTYREYSSIEWMQDFPPTMGKESECHHFKTRVAGAQGGNAGDSSRLFGRGGVGYTYTNATSRFNHVARTIAKPNHGNESNAALASRMRASTAPLRDEWSFPQFIGELRDAPRLIKDGLDLSRWINRNADKIGEMRLDRYRDPDAIGNAIRDAVPKSFGQGLNKAQKAGNAYLAYNFGVAPYLSDLDKLLGFSETVERRRKELNNLKERRKAKRRWSDCGSFETTETVRTLVGNPGSLYANVLRTWTYKRWAVANWAINEGSAVLPANDPEFMRMLLGINAAGVLGTAYELLPWSWFIDYFANVGQVLENVGNVGTFYCSVTICTRWKLESTHPFVSRKESGVDLYCTPGKIETEWFDRSIHSGMDLSFKGDILSPHQLAILGSLAVSRVKKQ